MAARIGSLLERARTVVVPGELLASPLSAADLTALEAAGPELPEGWCARCFEPPHCDRCHGAGRVPGEWGRDAAGQLRERRTILCVKCTDVPPHLWAAVNQRDAASMYSGRMGALIPAHYQDATFANWRTTWNTSQRDVAFEYTLTWPPARPLLFLAGDKGGGKTHMACVIGNDVAVRYGQRVGFYPAIDLLDRYRATMKDDADESASDIEAEMRLCDLVILDDFGAHSPTAYATERLTRFVDERYREKRPLIVTTNLAPTALDERVVSRLCDVRFSRVVEFKGDRRRQR